MNFIYFIIFIHLIWELHNEFVPQLTIVQAYKLQRNEHSCINKVECFKDIVNIVVGSNELQTKKVQVKNNLKVYNIC